MGSRQRKDPSKIFDVFTEIARPSTSEDSPFVLQKFPEDFDDPEVLKSLPNFAFPSCFESTTVDHFTFVLTDIDGKFKYGFCRHATGAQTCLCIISCLPWYEIFYKLLNLLAEILNRNEANNVEPVLQLIYSHKVPSPSDMLDVVTPSLTDKFSFVCPDPHQLPSIPESRNLTEYYNAIDTSNMIIIFASMLCERRVLVTSKKLSRLTACVHGAASLLYPMYWQHLYIPILPKHLLDYCSAPMPYLIGIHSSLLEKAKKQELGDAVILYADENKVYTEHEDLSSVPSDVMSQLKKQLKPHQSDKVNTSLIGDGVARAFLKSLVALLGGYRDALRFRPGEQITFDPDAFVQSRSSPMRHFLEQLMQTQTFEQFVEDRLDTLNAGEGFSDQFDTEVNMAGDKWGTQSRYREWSHHMKRQGKKLRRDGKDKWVEFTSKVRDRSKKTFTDIKEKIGELRKDEEPGRHTITTPSVAPMRPLRPPPPNMEGILGPSTPQRHSIISRRTSYERARKYNVMDLEEGDVGPASPRMSKRTSADDSELYDLNLTRVSVDLMADPDIQNIFKKSYSLEDLTLDEVDEAVEASENNGNSTFYDTNANKRISAMGPVAQNRRSLAVAAPPPSNSIIRARPVPSPRNSLKRDTPIRFSPDPDNNDSKAPGSLITLDSPNGETAVRPADLGISTQHEFDPLTSSPAPMGEPIKTQSNPQLDSALLGLEQGLQASLTGEESVPVPAPGPVLRHPPNRKPPTPRPRSSIISRNNAFKGGRPASVRIRSPTSQATDAANIREARTVFIQAEHTSSSGHQKGSPLDQFDPLKTGRVALDPLSSPRGVPSDTSPQDEDLLKEWNLDFNRMRPGASVGVTGLPLAPPLVTTAGIQAPRLQPNHSSLYAGYQPPTARLPYQGPGFSQLAAPTIPHVAPRVGGATGMVAQRISQYNVPQQRGGYPQVAPGLPPPGAAAGASFTLPSHSSPALCDPFTHDSTAIGGTNAAVAHSRSSWQTFD